MRTENTSLDAEVEQRLQGLLRTLIGHLRQREVAAQTTVQAHSPQNHQELVSVAQ